KILCLLMLILVFVYYSQGVLYPNGTLLSSVALISLLLISSLYFILFRIFYRDKLNVFIKAWTGLLVVNIAYFFWDGSLKYLGEFQAVLLNMLPFYAFYIFADKGVLKRKHLIWFFVV